MASLHLPSFTRSRPSLKHLGFTLCLWHCLVSRCGVSKHELPRKAREVKPKRNARQGRRFNTSCRARHSIDNYTQKVAAGQRRGKADSTRRSSQAVPHPSTNRALRRLTSEVGRDPVHSTRYGRQRKTCFQYNTTFLAFIGFLVQRMRCKCTVSAHGMPRTGLQS